MPFDQLIKGAFSQVKGKARKENLCKVITVVIVKLKK